MQVLHVLVLNRVIRHPREEQPLSRRLVSIKGDSVALGACAAMLRLFRLAQHLHFTTSSSFCLLLIGISQPISILLCVTFLLDGPFPVSDTGQHVMDPTSRPFPVAGCTRRSRRNGIHKEIKAGYLAPNRIKLCPLLPNICLCTPNPRSHKLHKLSVCKDWVLTWIGKHQICWKCLKTINR